VNVNTECASGGVEPLWNAAQFNQAVFGGKPPGNVQQVAHGLIYPALRKANVTIGPQRLPSPAQFQDAIEELNRLVGSLNCDPLSIYSFDIVTFPLQKGKKTYTIGQDPEGCECADFDYPRPQGIQYANTILQSSGVPLRFPLQLYTDQQWANVSLQDIGNTIPWALYNNQNHPISTLFLYGQPIADMLLELYMWHLIPTFNALSDVVILPPGYEDVLVLNLACRLAPHFQRVISPDVTAQARESLMRLWSYNAPQPIAPTNGLCRGGDTTFSMIAGAGGGGGGPGLNDPTTTLGDLLVRGSSKVNRLPIGDPGDVLMVDPASWSGMRWAPQATAQVSSVFGRTGDIIAQAGDYTVDMITGAMADPLIATGDLLVRGPADTTRLPVGADDQVLIADSSNLLGVRWATPATSAVSSVFGRTGPVVAQTGDYRADQVSYAVDTRVLYNDPPWINTLSWWRITNVPQFVAPTTAILAGTGLTGGGDLTQSRTLSVVADSTTQRVQVSQGTGTLVGTRPQINFIAGANATVSAADNVGANRVDVTISAAGGGGGGDSFWTATANGIASSLPVGISFGAAINPWAVLTLDGAVNDPTLTFRSPSTFAIAVGGVEMAFGVSATSPWPGYIQTRFQTNAAHPFIVNPLGGTVGIGTTNPQSQYALDVNGDVNISAGSVYRIGGVPIGGGGGGQNQTPWDQDINGNTKLLNNAGGIGVGVQASAGQISLQTFGKLDGVGFVRTDTGGGFAGYQASNDTGGAFQFVIGGSQTQPYSQQTCFWTFGVPMIFGVAGVESLRIAMDGNIAIASLRTTAPNAGSKQLWADPADGYRVKWVP